ncbi:hypothetical protein LIS77_13990 [Cytobacillus firmus]|nr:hypothetical protein [Cytobacillus firmus]USK37050.1 hypothetical protein LIS77_13990 [Cytobacillus firmus]
MEDYFKTIILVKKVLVSYLGRTSNLKSKKLDDDSPTKNDVKGAKGLAQLVKDGRYAEPTTARCLCELRVAKKIGDL